MRRKNEPVDVWQSIGIPPDGDITPCWQWEGKVNPSDGRPYFSVGGVQWLAYRLVWVLINGEIPVGQVVRHKVCDNERCCNPHHLLLGTQSDNELDKYAHERWGFPHAVIDDIKSIREKHHAISERIIADMVTRTHGVKVSQQRVSDILRGTRRASHKLND